MKSQSRSLRDRVWRHQWAVVGGLALVAFVLGIVGLHRLRVEAASPKPWIWADAVYFSLRLFGFNYDLGGDEASPYAAGNWQLWVARFLAPASTALAVLKAVTQAAATQITLWQVSQWKGHTVVCGAGERGRQLALSIRNEDRDLRQRRGWLPVALSDWTPFGPGRVVVIEKDGGCDTLDDLRKSGVRVIVGNVTDPAVQAFARLDSARTVVALTPCSDANLRVVLAASERDNGLPVRALASAPRSFAAMFEGQPPFARIEGGKECGFFDDNASAARVIVGKHLKEIALQLFREQRGARILVAGDGDVLPELLGTLIGQSQISGSSLPRLTLLTVDEDTFAGGFPLHHPQLPLVADLRILTMPLPRMTMVELESLSIDRPTDHFDLAFVACREDTDTLALAAHLNQQPRYVGRVVAGLAPSTSLHRLFKGTPIGNGVEIVNLVECACGSDQVLREPLDVEAKATHDRYLKAETDRAKQEGRPCPMGSTYSMRLWEHLRDDFRQANRSQVDHLQIKKRILEVVDSAETIELLAEAEHRRWMADRIFCGWRYAAVRDDAKRLHDCIRPYGDLSEAIKEKDRAEVRKAAAVRKDAC